jgi:hypothetical protein
MDPLLTGTDPDATHWQMVYQDPVLAGFDQDGSPIDRVFSEFRLYGIPYVFLNSVYSI